MSSIGYNYTKGFTLVELLVVITVIGILASVGFVNYNESRQLSRDRIRMATVEQLNLALRLYIQDNPGFSCATGFKIDGSNTGETLPASGNCANKVDIRKHLETFFNELPVDPLGPNNKDYYYYFDGAHNCLVNGNIITAPFIFSVNLERTASNQDLICDPPADGNHGGYERTTEYGGNKNPSVPFVLRME